MTNTPCQVSADIARYDRQLAREQAEEAELEELYMEHYNRLMEKVKEIALRKAKEQIEDLRLYRDI